MNAVVREVFGRVRICRPSSSVAVEAQLFIALRCVNNVSDSEAKMRHVLSLESFMPYRYWAWFTLNEMPKVATGECARLVQMYVPKIGHTSTWRPGERVIDILERGGQIESGTAIATFVNGRYPNTGHRHAAFYDGPVRSVIGSLTGIILLDQWNPSNPKDPPRPLIKRRSVYRKGKMRSDGSFPFISDNAEAFYVIEK